MSTLVMVRTVCCETYKCSGTRCGICPNRPENKIAAENCKRDLTQVTFGRRYTLPATPSTLVRR